MVHLRTEVGDDTYTKWSKQTWKHWWHAPISLRPWTQHFWNSSTSLKMFTTQCFSPPSDLLGIAQKQVEMQMEKFRKRKSSSNNRQFSTVQEIFTTYQGAQLPSNLPPVPTLFRPYRPQSPPVPYTQVRDPVMPALSRHHSGDCQAFLAGMSSLCTRETWAATKTTA